jgi:hypothetical protein
VKAPRILRLLVCMGLLALAGSLDVVAQGRWEFDAVTAPEYETFNPQIALDRWGNTHLMWSSRDPRRSGLQLFYTSNASGRFAAPIQVTDTGTVFDSSNADVSSFVFRLDSLGVAHVAFVANVENHLRLYYTNNAGGHFYDARFLVERTRYGMAVDSSGLAHVVWAEEGSNGINLHYWTSLAPEVSWLEATVPCNQSGYGCRVGDIEVEAGPRGIVAAMAADSASIYTLKLPEGTRGRVAIPGYDRYETYFGRADLRFRMALDAEGAIHILTPRYVYGRYRLHYSHNANSIFQTSLLVDSLVLPPSGFDLAFNGADRLVAMWSTDPPAAPGRTSVAEIIRPAKTWAIQTPIRDLDAILATGRETPKRGLRVAARGTRIAISTIARPDMTREDVVGVVTRSGLRPVVSYLHPDAAAAGMNVVVDAIAPFREKGSFGRDGFRGDTVSMRLVNILDTSRVVIGPSVVSWDGRLVSTMLFIRQGAAPGPVPVSIRIGPSTVSNVDTFFIVAPQHLGDSVGVLSGGGVLGSGGQLGRRSRRGVIVVDSLHLRSGLYSVDTNDIDPGLPGNQGFLPVTILALGPIHVDSGAVLSVSADHDPTNGRFGSAGPGGGGGGTGGWIEGGSGFSGGAGPGRYVNGPIGASRGSGVDERSSRWGGGVSLNGVPGGLVFPEAPGGGGSGHPFGTSGGFGRVSAREPSRLDSGGFGGATAGSQALVFDGPTSGGGGGSHASRGESGNDHNDATNGGAAVGSRPLVPLAGGSGGGGGGFSGTGIANGGGGGGALALFSYADVLIAGAIRADGAAGIGNIPVSNASGGGGGAGGGIVIGAKAGVRFEGYGAVTARGGEGGVGNIVGGRNGGRGGDGRIRIDGRMIGAAATRTTPRAAYSGPATGTNGSLVSRVGDTLRGSGEPGRRVRLFIRGEYGAWRYNAPVEVVVGPDSTWRYKLGVDAASGRLYIATMQERADNTPRSAHVAEPAWVMSPAGGNIVGQPAMSLSAKGHRFDCIKRDSKDSATILIRNTGVLSDLEITSVTIEGTGKLAFDREYAGERIAPGESMPLLVIFQPADTGRFKATVKIVTNAMPEGTATINLEGCAVAGRLATDIAAFDLGAVCVGDTVTRPVTLINEGDAPLAIEEIRGDDRVLEVISVDRMPGLSLAPGARETVNVRFVVLAIGTDDLRVRIETDGEPKRLELPVAMRDARPRPELDRSTLVFRDLNVTAGDTCDTRSFWVYNRSTLDTMVISDVRMVPRTTFDLLTPIIDLPVAPGDSVQVTIGICASTVGDYVAQLNLTFGRGNCADGSSLMLRGRATEGMAKLRLIPDDRRIDFMQTLVGTVAEPKYFVIENSGEVSARIAIPTWTASPGTSDGELSVGELTVREVAAGDTIQYPVTFAPRSIGRKEIDIRLATEDGSGWMDTLRVTGDGILPGISLNYSTIEFDDVRLGSSSDVRTLLVYNSGNAPDRVASITSTDGTPFDLVATDGPMDLDPGDTLRLSYRYTPTAERLDELTLAIATASGPTPIPVTLRGRGVLEHAELSMTIVDFGEHRRNAEVLKPDVLSIRNSGTHVMTITGAVYDPVDGLFAWDPRRIPEFPIVVQPGEQAYFSLQYSASASDTGAVIFETSAPETPLRVELYGRIAKEADTVDLMTKLERGYVNDEKFIPIHADFSTVTGYDARYSVTMSFEPGLLAPLGAIAGRDLTRAALAGTMSSEAQWDHVAPGLVRITGTVRGGSLHGPLLNVPMLVLTGPPAVSKLSIDSAWFSTTPGYVIRLSSGAFIGIDCDTGRGVIVKGRYGLAQSTPNPTKPFGAPIVIAYSVADRELVRINLYDASGNFVRALVDEVKEPGAYRLEINPATIGSGVYTYEMLSGPYRESRRMVVVE